MELLDAGVRPHSGLHDLFVLKNGQTLLDVAHLRLILLAITGLACLQFDRVHAAEEYLEDGLHVVDQHLLEVFLLSVEVGIRLFFPHLEDYALTDAPVADVSLELLNCQLSHTYIEVLRLLLCVLRHPVSIGCRVRIKGYLQNRFFVSNSFSMHL